ncbi:MAG TPA: histidine phosphatase family protein [Myxococcota bacterium]|nr:histidine phosphatase family protein [Myxococcota bacterium]
MSLRRLILIRHGETNGLSSIRYYGATDVELSDAGRAQMRRVAAALRHSAIDLWVASSLQRSWKGARLVSGGRQVMLEAGFREIDFGSWEGLTGEEIKARDPVRYDDWQNGADGFEYPNGELRAAFRARIADGLVRLGASGARTAACVLHKGVIREIVRALTGSVPERSRPALGEILELTCAPSGEWLLGSRSSNPTGLEDAA